VAAIGVIAAALTLMAAANQAWHVFKKTDWRTLLFFIGLFITVGGLEETGLLETLANYIGEVSGGSLICHHDHSLAFRFASAVIDNIPFAAPWYRLSAAWRIHWDSCWPISLDAGFGYRHRRQRDSDRSLSQCGGHSHCGKRRVSGRLGKISQIWHAFDDNRGRRLLVFVILKVYLGAKDV